VTGCATGWSTTDGFGLRLRSTTASTTAITATTATITRSSIVPLRNPLLEVEDAVMMIMANALCVTPFSDAVTFSTSAPTEFPAVKVAEVEVALEDETLPSPLLSVHV
jgi:hypothetical protein